MHEGSRLESVELSFIGPLIVTLKSGSSSHF
jgi:hypothetical protein